MRSRLPPGLAALLVLVAAPVSATADTVEQQFNDFFARQEEFAQRDKQAREEGYVLQRLYDPKGENAGTLSLGGGPDPEPQFGFSRKHNFTGTNFNDEPPPPQGILNLRLKF